MTTTRWLPPLSCGVALALLTSSALGQDPATLYRWTAIIELVDATFEALGTIDRGARVTDRLPSVLDVGRQSEVADVQGRIARHRIEDPVAPLARSLDDLLSDDPKIMRATLGDIERWVNDMDKSRRVLTARRDKYREIYARYKQQGDRLDTVSKRIDKLLTDGLVAGAAGDQLLEAKVSIDYNLLPSVRAIQGDALRLSRGYRDLLQRRAAELQNAKSNLENVVRPYVSAREMADSVRQGRSAGTSAPDSTNVAAAQADRLYESAKAAAQAGLRGSKALDAQTASVANRLQASAERADMEVARARREEAQRLQAERRQRETEFRQSMTENKAETTPGSPQDRGGSPGRSPDSTLTAPFPPKP